MLRVLEEQNFPVTELLPVASAKSEGRTILFQGREIPVMTAEDAIAKRPHLALFSAGGSVSLDLAPQFEAVGCRVIDNSSAWRMHADHKLVVPEVNGHVLTEQDYIIANPNCSTIQIVMVLNPLHRAYGVNRVVVSTYQSVSGSGNKGVHALEQERAGKQADSGPYPHPIDLNVLPHIDVPQDNGYTKEEMKMTKETSKIMGDESIRLTATAVRVPVMAAHSVSMNSELINDFEDVASVRSLLSAQPGIIVQDDLPSFVYPMPLLAAGKDEVFVGRIRRDETQANTLNCWIVADNLRKGAATNAVQIAMCMLNMGLLPSS
jgi:aspartate-semialdehyde dehydrogenase